MPVFIHQLAHCKNKTNRVYDLTHSYGSKMFVLINNYQLYMHWSKHLDDVPWNYREARFHLFWHDVCTIAVENESNNCNHNQIILACALREHIFLCNSITNSCGWRVNHAFNSYNTNTHVLLGISRLVFGMVNKSWNIT